MFASSLWLFIETAIWWSQRNIGEIFLCGSLLIEEQVAKADCEYLLYNHCEGENSEKPKFFLFLMILKKK